MGSYRQGFFKPKNPGKYKGNPTQIVYRSSWELKLMMDLDSRKEVISWSSEEVIVPYISPKDGKPHRYFPDFIVKEKKRDKITTYMIEIKPLEQTMPPKKRQKITKGYLKEIETFAVNSAKWDFAERFCKERGWVFQIMTEKDLHLTP